MTTQKELSSKGDILRCELADVTHAYVASLCFDDTLLGALSARLGEPGVAPRLRALATLRPFPEVGCAAMANCRKRIGRLNH